MHTHVANKCGAKEGRLPNVEGVRPTLFSSYRPNERAWTP